MAAKREPEAKPQLKARPPLLCEEGNVCGIFLTFKSSTILRMLIRRDLSITDTDDAMRIVRDVPFVSNQNDRVAFGVKLVEELHDLDAV